MPADAGVDRDTTVALNAAKLSAAMKLPLPDSIILATARAPVYTRAGFPAHTAMEQRL